MTNFKFLKSFEKELDGIEGVTVGSQPPRYSYNTGNYVLNKITSGNIYTGGIACQGRIGNISGPSGAGKSFLCANIIREAQKEGAFIVVLDSENALDSEFLTKIGVDTENNFMYIGVSTVQQVTNIVSKFLKQYKEEHGVGKDAPQVLIIIDSVSMLLTDGELEHYTKGEQRGDQGQKNKTTKHMLKTFVQDIKNLNVSMVVTSQVYKDQNMYSQEPWVVGEAIKYSASVIVIVTKSKLKEGTGTQKEVSGIRMRCEGFKVRYTKPFQVVTIDVPYEYGINKFDGLITLALDQGIIQKAGSRYKFVGEDDTWYEKDIEAVADKLLSLLEEKAPTFIKVED